MSDYREKSEFNNAISFLARIDVLFYICDDAAVNRDVDQWFHHLLVLRRELYNDMQKSEQEESDKYKDEIATMIINNKNKQVTPELYNKLDNFELILRRIYKAAGYQGKSKEDPRYALG